MNFYLNFKEIFNSYFLIKKIRKQSLQLLCFLLNISAINQYDENNEFITTSLRFVMDWMIGSYKQLFLEILPNLLESMKLKEDDTIVVDFMPELYKITCFILSIISLDNFSCNTEYLIYSFNYLNKYSKHNLLEHFNVILLLLKWNTYKIKSNV